MLAWLIGVFLWTGGGADPALFAAEESDSVDTEYIDTLSSRILTVNRVILIGNKITRKRIIDREVSLKAGDTIRAAALNSTLLWDKNKLYNLRLFNTVAVTALELPDDKIDILVELTERWYIFPTPIFELSDRNFNEWWNNYNHDFSRINYGLRLNINNFRGRNESLRFTAQFGFVRKFDMQYRIPNLGKSQKHGVTFDFDFGAPKNIAYQTSDHKLIFLEEQKVVRTTFGAGIGWSYRKSFFETHAVNFTFRESEVIDTVLMLNPIYYRDNKPTQRFFSLTYSFVSEHRDVVQYPLKGYQFGGLISKAGLFTSDDIDQLEINLTYSGHWSLGSGFYLSNFTSLFGSTRQNQPYNTFNALGYRAQIIRGFENYVIEGPDFGLNKTTLKKRIFHRSWTIKGMPIEQFNYFPLAIYIKTYADFGYVRNYPYYDENSFNQQFSNKFLSGVGFGVDFVTMYDLVLRLEYTYAQQARGAFFFNLKKEF